MITLLIDLIIIILSKKHFFELQLLMHQQLKDTLVRHQHDFED